MLHHPFCVEMRHYFYTNGDKVTRYGFYKFNVVRRSLSECCDGLYPRDNLQNHEVLPQNETNGTSSPHQALRLPVNEINCLYSCSGDLSQRHQALECPG